MLKIISFSHPMNYVCNVVEEKILDEKLNIA